MSGARRPGRRRVLVVGSWAKEHITVRHLAADPDVEVHAFLGVPNPAIMELADAHVVGRPSVPEEVVAYARESRCDLVLVTTAAPLEAGLADALEAAGIAVFAPTRAAARLECDKAFAREMLAECCPEAVPRFGVFADPDAGRRFAAELGWRVAVKPLGLTEGLGVRVFGDQLATPDDVDRYLTEVCRGGEVLLEERMEGEELTIQALVDGERLVPTPAVADFKKLLAGDRGPNTASMGSYAAAGHLLPFMTEAHYDVGVGIMRRTLAALAAAGTPARGFLYGQFMITAEGLRLVEYNFRPGDPEWLNTLASLDSSLVAAVDALLAGDEPTLAFRREASVVEYLVPREYPHRLGERLRLEIDETALAAEGVEAYVSAGLADDGSLDVGSERGVALLARDATIPDAHARVERAIAAAVTGEFHHRADIGSARQVRRKVARVHDLAAPALDLRPGREEDAADVHRFAADCPPLEPYPLHQYVILLRYFGATSVVARRHGELAGFEIGLPAADGETYFLWQIAVAESARGTGLARRILEQVEERARAAGCRRVEVTVDPENHASRRLFAKAGYHDAGRREAEVVMAGDVPAVRDHYGPGRHFVLLEKPLAPAAGSPAASDGPRPLAGAARRQVA